MGELTEIWILNGAGVCMFNYTTQDKMDPSLFGSFITAVNLLGESISNKSIQSLNLGDNILAFERLADYRIAFIGRGKNNKKEKVIRKDLHAIILKFTDIYSKTDVTEWNGDLSFFEKFLPHIKQFFMSKLEKTKGIW